MQKIYNFKEKGQIKKEMKDLQMLSKMKSINKKEDDFESSSFERKFHIKNCNTNYRLKIRQNSILNKKHQTHSLCNPIFTKQKEYSILS